LSVDEVASRTGFSAASIWDIESYPDELFLVYSPIEIRTFSEVLGVRPVELLAIETSEPRIAAAELVQRIQECCQLRRVTLEQFEDAVGWRLAACMESPELLLQELTVDALRCLCRELAVDWQRVLLEM
jgi:hypothetical protein